MLPPMEDPATTITNPQDVDIEVGSPTHEGTLPEETQENLALDEKPLPDPWPQGGGTNADSETSPKLDEPPVGKEVQFQDLQKDLVVFLGQHISKVTQMQAGMLDSRPRGKGDKDVDAFSGRASSGNIAIFSHLDLGGTKPSPVDVHLYALHQFLEVHLETVSILQESLQKGTLPAPPRPLSTVAETSSDPGSQYNAQIQQFAMTATTSVLLLLFLIAFLALSYSLIEAPARRIPFSVGMLFAWFCLGLLLLTVALSFWGTVSASWRRMRGMPESSLQSHFHLHLARQLQFCVIIAIFLPVVMLSFYMFSAIPFPVVFLVVLLASTVVVLGSVFYRVPITFENVSTLILGTRQVERPSHSLKPKRPTPKPRRSFY